IRDRTVTGVQTCALPISRRAVRDCLAAVPEPPAGVAGGPTPADGMTPAGGPTAASGMTDTSGAPGFAVPGLIVAVSGGADSMAQIGRAACRGGVKTRAPA